MSSYFVFKYEVISAEIHNIFVNNEETITVYILTYLIMTLDMFRVYCFFYRFGLVNIPYIAPHVGIVYYSLLIALKKTNEMSMTIDVREYRKSHQIWTIQRNRQHRARKTKTKNTKKQKKHNTT
jgi:hypothetical protein